MGGSSRLAGATTEVRIAVATAAEIPVDQVDEDEDFVDDLSLDELEQESLRLIVSDVFAVTVPDEIFATPLYRTSASFAEWLVAQSDHAAWVAARSARAR